MKTELSGLTWHGVSSSNIEQIAYDAEHLHLYVQFHHGGVYRYDGVTGTKFRYLLNAPSVGSYFTNQIRNSHSFTKLK